MVAYYTAYSVICFSCSWYFSEISPYHALFWHWVIFHCRFPSFSTSSLWMGICFQCSITFKINIYVFICLFFPFFFNSLNMLRKLFQWLLSVPLYEFIITRSTNTELLDLIIVSNSLSLWMMLQWTIFIYKFLWLSPCLNSNLVQSTCAF